MGRVLIFSFTRTSQIVSGQSSIVQPCMLTNLSQWMTDVVVAPIGAQNILSKLGTIFSTTSIVANLILVCSQVSDDHTEYPLTLEKRSHITLYSVFNSFWSLDVMISSAFSCLMTCY